MQNDVADTLEEWTKMFQLVELMQNLRLFRVDLADAMCTLGCCGLVIELKRSMSCLRGKKSLLLELAFAADTSVLQRARISARSSKHSQKT